MSKSIKRVALVTGAARGIGFEISRRLASLGLSVILSARTEDKGLAACRKLREASEDIHFQLLDVADPISVYAAINTIKDKFERLDVLVNNAGVKLDDPISVLALDPALLNLTLQANTFGPFLLCQACIPIMQAGGYGRIVNMSSTLGALADMADPHSPYAGLLAPAYRLSKTALNAVTVLFAKETRGTNVLINSVCPGWVRTAMGGPQAPLTAEEGAETPVWLATLPDDGPTGGFFSEKQQRAW